MCVHFVKLLEESAFGFIDFLYSSISFISALIFIYS